MLTEIDRERNREKNLEKNLFVFYAFASHFPPANVKTESNENINIRKLKGLLPVFTLFVYR